MSSPRPNQDTTPSPLPWEAQFLLCKWLVAVDLPTKFHGANTFARVRAEPTFVCASVEYKTALVAGADIDDAVTVDMMDEHLVAFLWKLADGGYMNQGTFEGVSWMFVKDRTRYGGQRY